MLGVLPEDLDAIQFGAVGRQIEQHHAMLEKPAIDAFLIDVVVDRGVVEDHHRCQAGRASRAIWSRNCTTSRRMIVVLLA
jgi:hypothetical protein